MDRRRGLAVAAAGWVAITTASGSASAQSLPRWGGASLSAGAFAWRMRGDTSPAWRRGFEAAWGPTLAIDEGAFRFTGAVQMEVRAFDASSWALALSTHSFEVAARLGFVEPHLRSGFALLSVDDFDGSASVELFSPRAGVGLGVRLGRRVRVSLDAYAEYFWRWFAPSVLIRGLSIEVRVERRLRERQ